MKFALTFLVLLFFVCTNFAADVDKDVEQENLSKFVFKKSDNKDPFYSAIDIELAKFEIEEAIRKDKADRDKDEDGDNGNKEKQFVEPVEGANEAETALAKARHYAERSQTELLQGNWELAIKEAEEGLEILKTAPTSSKYAEAMKIESLRLNGFRSTAREAKLNEEAEAKFNALKLEVQGIMWSADQRSLAIISGEAFHVQDKIGDGDDAVTIVNIDPNRVDFMINHARKRFEFKRYIDN